MEAMKLFSMKRAKSNFRLRIIAQEGKFEKHDDVLPSAIHTDHPCNNCGDNRISILWGSCIIFYASKKVIPCSNYWETKLFHLILVIKIVPPDLRQ